MAKQKTTTRKNTKKPRDVAREEETGSPMLPEPEGDSYPGPAPGTAVFVDYGTHDGYKRARLGILIKYTRDLAPVVRIAAVDPKGLLTGEMGAPRTFAVLDILGTAVMSGTKAAANDAPAVAQDREPKRSPASDHALEIRARLATCQARIDSMGLTEELADRYKLAVTCTCSSCSTDVGELCVTKKRGKLVEVNAPCEIRFEQAKKAAELIARHLGEANRDDVAPTAARAAEKERAQVEKQGAKALATATGTAPAPRTRKPSPVEAAVAAAAQPSNDPRELDDAQILERIAKLDEEAQELSDTINDLEASEGKTGLGGSMREELSRLVNEAIDLKSIVRKREKDAKALADAPPANATAPTLTLRQKQVAAQKANAPICAFNELAPCGMRKVEGEGAVIQFDRTDSRWACSEHVQAVEIWHLNARVHCECSGDGGCPSFFLARDAKGKVYRGAPPLAALRAPEGWAWLDVGDERKFWGPCHQREYHNARTHQDAAKAAPKPIDVGPEDLPPAEPMPWDDEAPPWEA